ncbi:MAG: extracellular solute-binding protein [Alicyclobacillus sp.]|nr:extracellular solute-binding protein [Alicyclobacillus sp.]
MANGLSGTHAASGQGNLSVLYAGSMTNVMEQKIRPAVKQQLGLDFAGEGKGSNELAQMIAAGIRQPDVFISASPGADQRLMGAVHHNLVRWYIPLATDQLVIAYNPRSRFAADLEAAAKGGKAWYQVLEEPGFRLGRTDPKLDPKGIDTIWMAELAQAYYHQPGLRQKLLGADDNPQQVFPEEALLAQLTSGQVDAIVAYRHEAVEWGVPYIRLPNQINLGDVADAAAYAKATYTSSTGQVSHGSPIEFTITIPATAPNEPGAVSFVRFMVAGAGHGILMKDGFLPVHAPAAGDISQMPAGLKSLTSAG